MVFLGLANWVSPAAKKSQQWSTPPSAMLGEFPRAMMVDLYLAIKCWIFPWQTGC